ncbi:MAG TPA: pyridoxal phosphate-dependent aminotransferase, partial [Nitrospiria bacterium]|nr:pyridoxal phosphate-dependent aminotransferase [Nitrospiria bacterium]
LSTKAKALRERKVDVVDFGLGEPDFDTPEPVKAAAIEAIRAGFTKYTPPGGTPELKSAVAEKLRRDNGLAYETSQVTVSCGAKHSLFNLCQVLFDEGDEVLIPAPYWVSYPEQVRYTGAEPVTIAAAEKNGFLITPEQLSAAITPRSRALILNSPSNPTGATYTRKQLEALADLAIEKDLLVISDEIYEPFIYGGLEHASIASVRPQMFERTVVVNGLSKSHAMTGWRIGYAAGPADIIKSMEKIQGQSTSNPNSIAQKAAVAALYGGDTHTRAMVSEFDKRRRYILEQLNAMRGVRCAAPSGAFYVFPNIAGLLDSRFGDRAIKTDGDLAEYLLDEAE